jgi:hypothetical protein
MKHLATIQTEFLKAAKTNYWEQLSYDAQVAYLKKHRRSKRRLTRQPGEQGDLQLSTVIDPISDNYENDLVKLYGVKDADYAREMALPNGPWGHVIYKNKKDLMPNWQKIADKYKLHDLVKEYRSKITVERKIEIRDTFTKAIGEFEDRLKPEEAKSVLQSLVGDIDDANVEKKLSKAINKVDLTKTKAILHEAISGTKWAIGKEIQVSGVAIAIAAALKLFKVF